MVFTIFILFYFFIWRKRQLLPVPNHTILLYVALQYLLDMVLAFTYSPVRLVAYIFQNLWFVGLLVAA
jgi:hypothetical protein